MKTTVIIATIQKRVSAHLSHAKKIVDQILHYALSNKNTKTFIKKSSRMEIAVVAHNSSRNAFYSFSLTTQKLNNTKRTLQKKKH